MDSTQFSATIESWNWSYRLQIILHTFALSILSTDNLVLLIHFSPSDREWRRTVCDLWPIKNSTLMLMKDNSIVRRKQFSADFFFLSVWIFFFSCFLLNFFPLYFGFFFSSFSNPQLFRYVFIVCSFWCFSSEFCAFVIFHCASIYPKNQQFYGDIAFIVSSHAA